MALTMTRKRLDNYNMIIHHITMNLFAVVGIDILNDGSLYDQDGDIRLEFENRPVTYGNIYLLPNQRLFSISDKRIMDWVFRAYVMKLMADNNGESILDTYGTDTITFETGRKVNMYIKPRFYTRYTTANYSFEACAILESIFFLSQTFDMNEVRAELAEFDALLSILINTRRTNNDKMKRSGIFV